MSAAVTGAAVSPPPIAPGAAIPPPPPLRRADAAALVAPVDSAGRGSAAWSAESQPSATAAPARAPEEVHEQAPQIARAKAIAVTKTAPSRRMQPGDLICGACGEGNPSTRRFCSRCGSSLVTATTVKESWWRRLLRKLIPRRGPKVVKLDSVSIADGKDTAKLTKSGPNLKHAFRRIFRVARVVIALVVVIGGILYGAYPPFRNAINNTVESDKKHVSNDIGIDLSPIHAVKVTASTSTAGFPPLNAADENLSTYWLAPWSSTAEPALTFTFSGHVTVQKMILHVGASNAYIQDGRPSELRLVFSNGESDTITPQDTASGQTFTITHAEVISSMQVEVEGVYPGSAGSNVAIAEIELFGYNL